MRAVHTILSTVEQESAGDGESACDGKGGGKTGEVATGRCVMGASHWQRQTNFRHGRRDRRWRWCYRGRRDWVRRLCWRNHRRRRFTGRQREAKIDARALFTLRQRKREVWNAVRAAGWIDRV
jgi:hypothetical protein